MEAKNIANGQVASQAANEQGEYHFPQLAPGAYLITASSSGFGTQTKRAELLVNQPATVNFELTVQASTVTVDVSAQTQILNDSDATIGNALNNATIAALPSEGRNVPDLLSLQPGVLYLGHGADKQSDSRTGSVAGARSDQTNVTLDGLDDNDQTQGYAFTGVLRSTLDS
ncbi:MAG TPA: carboxypeptidase-like regulatory domain-containing protein, partial [Silvibacterium sp.]|nr:carboxypeptidase-like regulatory domain-containing protein [Silvibacterium sp.]